MGKNVQRAKMCKFSDGFSSCVTQKTQQMIGSHFFYPTHRDKTTIETIHRTTMALSRCPCPFGPNNPSNNHPFIQPSIHTSLATHNTMTFLHELEGRSISGVSVFLFFLRHFRAFSPGAPNLTMTVLARREQLALKKSLSSHCEQAISFCA
jgi:hypothetical protein